MSHVPMTRSHGLRSDNKDRAVCGPLLLERIHSLLLGVIILNLVRNLVSFLWWMGPPLLVKPLRPAPFKKGGVTLIWKPHLWLSMCSSRAEHSKDIPATKQLLASFLIQDFCHDTGMPEIPLSAEDSACKPMLSPLWQTPGRIQGGLEPACFCPCIPRIRAEEGFLITLSIAMLICHHARSLLWLCTLPGSALSADLSLYPTDKILTFQGPELKISVSHKQPRLLWTSPRWWPRWDFMGSYCSGWVLRQTYWSSSLSFLWEPDTPSITHLRTLPSDQALMPLRRQNKKGRYAQPDRCFSDHPCSRQKGLVSLWPSIFWGVAVPLHGALFLAPISWIKRFLENSMSL